jgi:hypothetical protein
MQRRPICQSCHIYSRIVASDLSVDALRVIILVMQTTCVPVNNYVRLVTFGEGCSTVLKSRTAKMYFERNCSARWCLETQSKCSIRYIPNYLISNPMAMPVCHRLSQWKNQSPIFAALILKITYPRLGICIVSFNRGFSIFGFGYRASSEGGEEGEGGSKGL